ncbi:CsbD family protein [Lacticaseibacillus saniviri]|uniref:CsbD-like domain-containing protein n=1 Tax=Lacticaseibacillus saniviri JCM 17471 = DSM 24301 TaxID=1293598 RepID=A0A0R2N2W8_9LACO|nr:CsbD family protein [Lacticaseibacillus saniviri]KRO18083.1 hypothetical protein IV56_GL001880 [Lacticaseibacillus saniviri JCM 17471 = DSM 24301]MCG4281050.1 CsbD family protein [Lacticaseibacillus saniviri]
MADFDSMKDKVVGKVKEETGKLTNNEELEAKGKAEQLKGAAKEKVNDAKKQVGEAGEDMKEKAAKKFNDTVDKADK